MNAWMVAINQMAAAGLAALLNTLWYAAAVVVLTWVVLRFSRRVNAATRYWIWTAVLCFLLALPFLPGLAARLHSALTAQTAVPTAAVPLAKVSIPPVVTQQTVPAMLTVDTAPGSNPWPLLLLAVWVIVACWLLVRLLRGVVLLRRLKVCADAAATCTLPVRLRRRVRVLTSCGLTSPVAVGYLHPAIIFPPDLVTRLEEDEKRDALLHELAHLARYDDWVALGTYALRALLALHPLAPFVLSRIEREREIACDDFAVAHTGSARNYARSLARLHDLRSTEGTRLLAPALLGRRVSLADRIESLLRHGREFSARPSLAKLGVSALLLVLLLGAGGLIPGWVAIAATKTKAAPRFEVATIKPSPALNGAKLAAEVRAGRKLGPHIEGAFAIYTYMPLKGLIAYAYKVKMYEIVGPAWLRKERFDIEAKIPDGASKDDAPEMLQALLENRFKLVAQRDTEERPVLALVVVKNGPKLKKSPLYTAPINMKAPLKPGQRWVNTPFGPLLVTKNPDGSVTTTKTGKRGTVTSKTNPQTQTLTLQFSNMTMAGFASMLTSMLQQMGGGNSRRVVDQTGLKGDYQVSVEFYIPALMALARARGVIPPKGSTNGQVTGASPATAPSEPGGAVAPVFASLKKLGLKLEPRKAKVEELVIDHIEKTPTPN